MTAVSPRSDRQIARPEYQRTLAVRYRLLEVLCGHPGALATSVLLRSVGARGQRAINICRNRLSDLVRVGHAAKPRYGYYEATEAGRGHVRAVRERELRGVQGQGPSGVQPGSLIHLLLAHTDDATPLTGQQIWNDRAGITEAGIELSPPGETIWQSFHRLADRGLVRRVDITSATTFTRTEAGRAALAEAAALLDAS